MPIDTAHLCVRITCLALTLASVAVIYAAWRLAHPKHRYVSVRVEGVTQAHAALVRSVMTEIIRLAGEEAGSIDCC